MTDALAIAIAGRPLRSAPGGHLRKSCERIHIAGRPGGGGGNAQLRPALALRVMDKDLPQAQRDLFFGAALGCADRIRRRLGRQKNRDCEIAGAVGKGIGLIAERNSARVRIATPTVLPRRSASRASSALRNSASPRSDSNRTLPLAISVSTFPRPRSTQIWRRSDMDNRPAPPTLTALSSAT